MSSFTSGARHVVAAAIDAVARSAPRGSADPPSRRVLGGYAARQSVAALLLLVAADVCRVAGLDGQSLPYAVIAVALLPQTLTALVAVRDESRRNRLRVDRRPSPLPALVAAVLGTSGLATALGAWQQMADPVQAGAALIGATGMAVAAWPVQLVFARRREDVRLWPGGSRPPGMGA